MDLKDNNINSEIAEKRDLFLEAEKRIFRRIHK